MKIIIIAIGFIALSTAQDHRNAAILSDTRYLAGDGTFGSSYKQEDGVEFKEESDANGDRKGSYSYVDPNGVRRTVTYTAGKNGFQASGDGIPKAPPQIPPQPEYEPLPQYNPPDYRPPAHAYPQYQPQQPAYQPRPAPPPPPPPVFRPNHQPQFESRPASPAPLPPAFRPNYQPRFDVSHQPQFQPQYQQLEPAYQPRFQFPEYQSGPEYRPDPQFKPDVFRYSFTSPGKPTARPQYNEFTTPSPRRFYPPGKLDFTRTPDGFNYSFTKN